MSITYKDAGVDIEKGDAFVERIKKKVHSTYSKRVVQGVGGFACLYDGGHDKYLAAGTDGVGTKLKIAQALDKHDTIGIDLVAMCVNDVICTGAMPLFFMDYLACGELKLEASEQIIDGVVEGCKQSEAALIGGETAEMPGMYGVGEYDLAGFCVGEVLKDRLIDGSNVKEEDTLIGLASSGLHSNGFSLVRKLFKEDETDWQKACLEPTRIYVSIVKQLLEKNPELINGISHITGGGVYNIARINEKFDYRLDQWISKADRPRIFDEVEKRSGLGAQELYKTFNMGIGLVMVTSQPEQLESELQNLGEKCWRLGQVTAGKGETLINF